MSLLNYDQFVLNNSITESRRQLVLNVLEQFEEVRPVINEAIEIVNLGAFDGFFIGEELDEANIAQKMKAKFDAAINIAKTKGKDALTSGQEMIVKLGGNIANIIKLIVSKLKEWVSETFAAAKSHFSGAAATAKDKIGSSVKSVKDKNKLADEVKNLKNIAKATGQWVTSGFVADTAKAAGEAAKEDVTEAFELAVLTSINEAIIDGTLDFRDLMESDGHGPSIPFVSTIAHKLHHIPPFNLLDKVKQGAEKIAAGTLNKFSYYATKLAGAPGPFEFTILAGIIGVVAEVQFKGVAKHALLHAVPGLGLIASIISNVAMAMAVIAIVESFMQEKETEH
jgi:hypothetical protein